MLISRRRAAAGLLAGFGVSGLAGTAAFAQAPIEAAPQPDETVDTTRGRFEHIMAPVKINGAGPFKFLIDTGANTSCVSQLLADRLALTPGPMARVHTVVGVRERPSVIIDHLEVGVRTRRDVKAPSLNMATSIQADGVLGVDWLKGQRIVFDFKAQTLEIARSKTELEAEKRVIVPASRRWGQLTIIDADASGEKIRALLDSGSQLTICNTAMRDMILAANRRKRMPEEQLMVSMETVAGEAFTGRQLSAFPPPGRPAPGQCAGDPRRHACLQAVEPDRDARRRPGARSAHPVRDRGPRLRPLSRDLRHRLGRRPAHHGSRPSLPPGSG